MSLNFFRNAYLVDFGATTAPLHAQQLQALRRLNYSVVSSGLAASGSHPSDKACTIIALLYRTTLSKQTWMW